MSSFIASKVGKILAERVLDDVRVKKLNINSENPYEEQVPVYDKNGRPTNKTKKRKRPLPTNLSPNDTRVLKKVRQRAYHLDMSLFNLCGFRIGWSSVIAIIPVIGDFIDMFMALMVVHLCDKVEGGIPKRLRAQMMFNILIDFGVGLVPIVGDIADMLFRANTRNAWLLETYLVKKAEAERAGAVTDPETGKTLLTRPEPSREASGKSLGRFFGFGGASNDVPDEEMSVGVTNNGSRPVQQVAR